jgi:DNA helicase II / ATP-dependent DNA helicase PcrA
MRGRDIGKQLTAIVHEVAKMRGFRYDRFGEFLEAYAQWRIHRLAQFEGNEGAITSLRDRIDSIRIIAQDRPDVVDIPSLCTEIEQLFEENQRAIVCSSVHRVKGQEADTVFIIAPDKLPLEWLNQQAWEWEQERNLKYVSLTRARQALWFVG